MTRDLDHEDDLPTNEEHSEEETALELEVEDVGDSTDDENDDEIEEETSHASDEEPGEQEPSNDDGVSSGEVEALGDIIDPRLATIEHVTLEEHLTPTADEPKPAPSIEGLQAELAAAIEARDFAHANLQSQMNRAQQAEEAAQSFATAAASEAARREELEGVLRSAQAALLEATMRSSSLDHELEATRTELLKLQQELTALGKRHIFQIIPAFKAGQKRDTRIYVLADSAADAIRRVERAGVLDDSEVENITKTSQKLVIVA
jgi:hypothetical protein